LSANENSKRLFLDAFEILFLISRNASGHG